MGLRGPQQNSPGPRTSTILRARDDLVSSAASQAVAAAQRAQAGPPVERARPLLDAITDLCRSIGAQIAARVIHASLDSYLHNGWSMDYFELPPSDLTVAADPDAAFDQIVDAQRLAFGVADEIEHDVLAVRELHGDRTGAIAATSSYQTSEYPAQR